MLYDNWLGDITERFQRRFDAINVEHNFELGHEFEVALALLLREILPLRFGVCRGYVVARDGTKAGDDIIIFDAQRFPVLRELERSDLTRKQHVPAEAVLAYIEAKHTLYFEGDGRQSLKKALSQVRAVKELPRPRVEYNQVLPGINLGPAFKLAVPPHLPDIRNPYYGAIWARHAKEGSPPAETGWFPGHDLPVTSRADVVVAGPNLFVPGLPTERDGVQRCGLAPFATPTTTAYACAPKSPWGTAIAHLLWAMEAIQLGELPWSEMMQEQVPGFMRLDQINAKALHDALPLRAEEEQ